MIGGYVLLGVAVALMIMFMAIRVTKGGISGLLSKTLASLAFVALALVGAYYSGFNLVSLFIILGLIFGMIGDIVLDLKIVYKNDEKSYLNAGMLSFGLGHVMYFVATILYALNIVDSTKLLYLALIGVAFALLVTIFIGVFGKSLLKLDFGEFKIQSLAYSFILSFMSAFSVAVAVFKPIFLIFALGIVFIFLSDLVLSMQYFGGKQDSKFLTIVNHSVYYLGQIAIAFSLLFI